MLHVITGGSGSGKSAYGEEQVVLQGEKKRIYIATMYPFDQESHKRIARHREMRRGKGFDTVERYTDLGSLKLFGRPVVLLECMSNLVANEMFREDGAKEKTFQAVLEGVENVRKQSEALIIITNEIFSDGNFYESETEEYQRVLGKINEELARRADQVTEVVYGIPVKWKG